jgi:hypothetical protein
MHNRVISAQTFLRSSNLGELRQHASSNRELNIHVDLNILTKNGEFYETTAKEKAVQMDDPVYK